MIVLDDYVLKKQVGHNELYCLVVTLFSETFIANIIIIIELIYTHY